jgi:hypothetical protein
MFTSATTGPGAAFSPTGLHHLIRFPDRTLLGATFWLISTTPARFLGRTGIRLMGPPEWSEVSEALPDFSESGKMHFVTKQEQAVAALRLSEA